ncbi:hypothetical protein BH24BAC1_BH24BAC1_15670 [soil metagenome]|jgi:hypothetical protein
MGPKREGILKHVCQLVPTQIASSGSFWTSHTLSYLICQKFIKNKTDIEGKTVISGSLPKGVKGDNS